MDDDRSCTNTSRVSPSSPVRCEALHRNYFNSDCQADNRSCEGDKHNKNVNQSPQTTSASPSSIPPPFHSRDSTGVYKSGDHGDHIPQPLYPPAETPATFTSSSYRDCEHIKLIKDSSEAGEHIKLIKDSLEVGDKALESIGEHGITSVDQLTSANTDDCDLDVKGKFTEGIEPGVKSEIEVNQRGSACCSDTIYSTHLSKSVEVEKQFSESLNPPANDTSSSSIKHSGQLVDNKQTKASSIIKHSEQLVDNKQTEPFLECVEAQCTVQVKETPAKRLAEEVNHEAAIKSDSEATNDSLFVNKDTDSTDTVNDTVDDLCTQYSLPDIDEGDVHVNEVDNNSDVSVYENADSCCISKEISQSDFRDTCTADSDFRDTAEFDFRDTAESDFRDTAESDFRDTAEFLNFLPSTVRTELQRKLPENLEDRKQAKLRSLPLQKQVSESDSSAYDSFYSFENVTDCGLVPIKSKKALRWTPRILSESRFSSTFSSTFSDAASFYTAETSGTFYSAKSFQLDSCDNFQTCEDFQKIAEEPKSKLSKAKDVLVRGKDFVKSKFDNYRKRLPNWRKGLASDSGSRSEISCLHHPCGFSCVHLGKEISQYSIPESSCVRGDNPEVITGDRSVVIEADVAIETDVAIEDVRNSKADGAAMLKKGAADEGTKDHGIVGSGTKRGSTGKQIYSIIADEEDESGPWSSPKHSKTVKMETAQREATEAEEDDMPVGTEALTIPRSRKPTENGDGDDRPSIKRLRWVSALEKTQESSLRSSLTSNSSVVELLQQREMDPETLLNNLGFGGGPHTDESANRVPERFLMNPAANRGVNLYEFVLNHPELHHILPLWDTNPSFPRTVDPATLTTGSPMMNGGAGGDCGGNQSADEMLPKSTRGSMQRPNPFSSVFHGMKFLHNTQTPAPPSPDEEMKRISSIPSILDYANRKALAQQGFYGRQYMAGDDGTAAREPAPGGLGTRSQSMQGLNAAERRKHFHRTAKSRNWSMTNENEANNANANANTSDQSGISDESSESFDRGLMLRSFSERFSSESSVESNDMYDCERRQLIKQNSISNLRRQYEETIRNSVDRDSPVFDDLKTTSEDKGRKTSISDIRKSQVNRLMSSLEDDGDYFAQSRQSSLKETESVPSLKLKQSSTQSGSPITPRDFSFSFDNALHDGESEFDFMKSESPRSPVPGGDTQTQSNDNDKPTVSIVVENGPAQENIKARVATVSNSSNPNELTPLSLVGRSDSSNTLVPQDSACDGENVEGEVTPRQGDITQAMATLTPECANKLLRVHSLSESIGSTISTATIVPKDEEDFMDTSVLPADLDLVDDVISRSPGTKDSLKPSLICPPQESFELEEISSAENAYEDINGNLKHRKGHMEKSLSAHSDSSGFADTEMPGEMTPGELNAGEMTPGELDAVKDTIVPRTTRRTFPKQKTFDSGRLPHDDSSLPLSQQTENSQREITMEGVPTLTQAETYLSDNDKTLFVCKKETNMTDDSEITHPILSSISYIPDIDCDTDKAVVYTVNIPYQSNLQNQVPETNEKVQKRFVSQVQLDIATKPEGAIHGDSDSNKPQFVLKGPVKHKEIRKDSDSKTLVDAEMNSSDTELVTVETDVDSVESLKSNQRIFSEINGLQHDSPKDVPIASEKAIEIQCSQDVPEVVSGYKTIGAFDSKTGPESVKHDVVSKKKNKEALIAANNHTAKWLLGNERHSFLSAGKKSQHDAYSVSRPMWASSPNLDNENADSMDGSRSRRHLKQDGRHSLDLGDEEAVEDFIQPGRYFTTDSIPEHQLLGQSLDGSEGFADDSASRRRFEEPRPASVCSSMDESVVVPRRRIGDESSSMPRDQLQYHKLSRLVSGPSLVLNPSMKMPTIQFTPNVHMKNWMQLPKQKHLEEETILMQHAIQRYRSELNVMESMLINSCQQASSDLNTEEREEVEELRHLWSEVQKEVCKMEQLLSVRLSEVQAGNESYSPLDALQIVQAMVDLLREQLYQQQMCINRDINYNEEEDRVSVCPSVPESSVSSTGLSELSQKVTYVQQMVSVSEQNQKQELKKCLSELQSNLLSEVRSEITSTQNVKMLQLQLQARDNEVKRLKMELLLQGVESGSSRKRQIFESDV